MLKLTRPNDIPGRFVEQYIRSIGKYYAVAVILVTALLGATYLTVRVALDRHDLQQNISYLTSGQFVRFQQLVDDMRTIVSAAADTRSPADTLVRDIRESVEDIRRTSRVVSEIQLDLEQNMLERLWFGPDPLKGPRLTLEHGLENFLEGVERMTAPRQAAGPDGHTRQLLDSLPEQVLVRHFSELMLRAYKSSDESILAAKRISATLLALIAAGLLLGSVTLFRPLLRKLRKEHDRATEFECRLARLAHTDELTGLGNRAGYNVSVANMVDRLTSDGESFSILLVDLDRFKSINDVFGHPAGDAVLCHVAEALHKTFHSNSVIARLGGDEFAVLLPGIDDVQSLAELAGKAVEKIGLALEFGGRRIQVCGSVGGAVAPLHACEQTELIRVADLALYNAKRLPDRVMIYDGATVASQLEQNQFMLGLVLALDKDEFLLHYQPQIDLATGRHTGFEALIRWKHPELGLLPPSRFLPLMEGTDLIRNMTRLIVAHAGRDLRVWKDAGLNPGPVAINMPEGLLLEGEAHTLLADAISRFGLEWGDFAVEITENVFIDRSADQMRLAVAQFREKGVSISLDDFGTGFASLIHLRDFPFDELKIDRSFVASIGSDVSSEQIIRAMLDLARNLGKRCIAEGIETEAQWAFLADAGCEVGQGYFFAQPQAADAVTGYLRATTTPGDSPFSSAFDGSL